MPELESTALDDEDIAHLLVAAKYHHNCGDCFHHAAMDYCGTCDEFYWLHQPGCLRFVDKHYGHRLTVVPFVEDRSK